MLLAVATGVEAQTYTESDDLVIRREDDTISATDAYEHGGSGGVWMLNADQRLELVLDSSPTLPIEWSVDYEVMI